MRNILLEEVYIVYIAYKFNSEWTELIFNIIMKKAYGSALNFKTHCYIYISVSLYPMSVGIPFKFYSSRTFFDQFDCAVTSFFLANCGCNAESKYSDHSRDLRILTAACCAVYFFSAALSKVLFRSSLRPSVHSCGSIFHLQNTGA